jgi:hypothetical protein
MSEADEQFAILMVLNLLLLQKLSKYYIYVTEEELSLLEEQPLRKVPTNDMNSGNPLHVDDDESVSGEDQEEDDDLVKN